MSVASASGREIAILKRWRAVYGIGALGESLGLAMLGGVLGCAGAWALLHTVDITGCRAGCLSISQ
jgi:hypothetical protein